MAKRTTTHHKSKPKTGKHPVRLKRHAKRTFRVAVFTLWHSAWIALAIIIAFPFALIALWLLSAEHTPTNPFGSPQHAEQLTSFSALRSIADCRSGMVLSIVAHEDDDLLLINPSLQHAAAKRSCIRTIYITAGDDGRPESYWRGREHGVQAAYAAMLGVQNNWQTNSESLSGHVVTVSSLVPSKNASLVFLHLPDGGPEGFGYNSNRIETLKELQYGTVKIVHTVDNASSYTAGQLVSALAGIMNLDAPSAIYTQAYGPSLTHGDHSDHQATGYFVNLARREYRGNYTFTSFLGYQVNAMPANLDEADSTAKRKTFEVYAQYDSAICVTTAYCPNMPTYSKYIQRQYVYLSQTIAARRGSQ
ncbi:MAG TPA: PIG-L family deacetylase [Candidatus Saccharimonadales bacterium]|nr:PIG-L family deacetylase [Candidatus Saccharimonadales bacterium]